MSKAIEAAMRKDFGQAALNLLDEFPLLASMKDLSEVDKKDGADNIANGMRMLFHAYKIYKTFAQSANLMSVVLICVIYRNR